jgi:hypothetical protein
VEVMTAVYNGTFLVMLLSAVLAARLSTRAGALLRTLRKVELLSLMALTNLIVVPLVVINGLHLVFLVIALAINAYIARTRARERLRTPDQSAATALPNDVHGPLVF